MGIGAESMSQNMNSMWGLRSQQSCISVCCVCNNLCPHTCSETCLYLCGCCHYWQIHTVSNFKRHASGSCTIYVEFLEFFWQFWHTSWHCERIMVKSPHDTTVAFKWGVAMSHHKNTPPVETHIIPFTPPPQSTTLQPYSKKIWQKSYRTALISFFTYTLTFT